MIELTLTFEEARFLAEILKDRPELLAGSLAVRIDVARHRRYLELGASSDEAARWVATPKETEWEPSSEQCAAARAEILAEGGTL